MNPLTTLRKLSPLHQTKEVKLQDKINQRKFIEQNNLRIEK